jgi:hypothetical protein
VCVTLFLLHFAPSRLRKRLSDGNLQTTYRSEQPFVLTAEAETQSNFSGLNLTFLTGNLSLSIYQDSVVVLQPHFGSWHSQFGAVVQVAPHLINRSYHSITVWFANARF